MLADRPGVAGCVEGDGLVSAALVPCETRLRWLD